MSKQPSSKTTAVLVKAIRVFGPLYAHLSNVYRIMLLVAQLSGVEGSKIKCQQSIPKSGMFYEAQILIVREKPPTQRINIVVENHLR